MLLQKLVALARRTAVPEPIGLELRADRFTLIHLDRTSSSSPLILGHSHHTLFPGDHEAAAEALSDAWHRLALPGKQVVLSVPSPPARFALLPIVPGNGTRPKPAWHSDDLIYAEVTLPARSDHPPQVLVGAVPGALLETSLALLDLAGLEAVQVQIDILALLTAFSHTPAWTGQGPIARTLVHASDAGFSWYALSPADDLPQEIGLAQDGTELSERLTAQPPDLLMLAGPVGTVQPLMTDLQSRLPSTRFCTNPFAGCRLAHEEDRRPITARAPELSVALGLALGACP
ncbi:hypothetical protein [Paludibacterium purpuratum]|uniref:Uncharacterized protein n=1 Tax=Paludibacterium purpuratum TaxID=1144873 RepID=A0A4R7B7T3_9NEIS|nr:hypothetical protein [Paludibacterium purpuratum]TDR80781.1 hypothetical protein DFP86_104281 [Paludibacterium purpuratum]